MSGKKISNSRLSPQPEQAELQGIKNIIKHLEKAERGYILYPPESPILLGFIEDLVDHFNGHLEEYGSLEFTINSTDMTFKGNTVYSSEDRGKSLAFRFFQSGLRTLGFNVGLTKEEIVDFLEIQKISQTAEEHEDDVVTLLWEKDCPHITYMTIDYFSDEESQEVVRKLAEVQVDPKTVASKVIRHITTTSMDIDKSFIPDEEGEGKIEEDLYSLQSEELEALRERINWEKDYNPLVDFTRIIFKILEEDISPEEFQDLAEVISSLLLAMIGQGHFKDVTGIMANIKTIANKETTTPEQKKALEFQLKKMSTPKNIQSASFYLKAHKDTEKVRSICQFFLTLDGNALLPICNLFREIEPFDELIQTLHQMTLHSYNILLTKLHDSNLNVVIAMMKVLALKKDPKILKELLFLLKHKDPKIRLEAVQATYNYQHPQIQSIFLQMIEDSNLSVKKMVLEKLVHMGTTQIFQPLLELVLSKTFLERDFFEKKALLVTMAKADPDKAFPELVKLVKSKNWFLKKELQEETRQCAALALGETKKLEAKPLLQKYASSQSSKLSNACLLGLKKLTEK